MRSSLKVLMCDISGPLIAHVTDKMPTRRIPLPLSLAGYVVRTILIAWSSSLIVHLLEGVLRCIAGSAVGLSALSLQQTPCVKVR